MKDDFELVTKYELIEYPCGLRAGDRLVLMHDFESRDEQGAVQNRYERGEIWTVLPGVKNEANVIWLSQPSGKRHTWDNTIFETFSLEERERK